MEPTLVSNHATNAHKRTTMYTLPEVLNSSSNHWLGHPLFLDWSLESLSYFPSKWPGMWSHKMTTSCWVAQEPNKCELAAVFDLKASFQQHVSTSISGLDGSVRSQWMKIAEQTHNRNVETIVTTCFNAAYTFQNKQWLKLWVLGHFELVLARIVQNYKVKNNWNFS